jgi:outer membrane receptor protein involved in Fe transport
MGERRSEHRASRIAAMLALGVGVFPVTAQEARTAAAKASEIVVTASRTESTVSDVHQSVSVLTRAHIEASPFERVEDLVRLAPGLYNYRHYGQQTSGIQSPLSMRGVGKNRVLILVDGIPQNDTFNNSISWVAWGHIPKENIERIEIVRGPSSALYGSDGLGGVVNIVTKNATTARVTSLRGEAGTANTYAGYGFHSQTFQDTGVVVGGGYEESDGFYMVEFPRDYEIRRHRQVRKALAKVSYALAADSVINLSALHYSHETGKGRPFFYDELDLNQCGLHWRRRGPRWDVQSLLYLISADKTAYQDSVADNYRSLLRQERMTPRTWGGDLQGTVAFARGFDATLGLAYKDCDWEYEDRYVRGTRDVGARGRQRFLAPFANLDVRFLDDDATLSVGARYDWIETAHGANWDSQAAAGRSAYHHAYDTESAGAFSPKLGLVWRADERTTWRMSAGQGFRAPSLFELYKVHVRSGGAYYREANPELDPEEIWSYDLGADRWMTDRVWGRIAFYQSFARAYIGDRLTGSSSLADGTIRYDYRLDNIGAVDIYGVEAEAEWHAADALTGFANYTFNVSKVVRDDNNAALKGNDLPNEPRHSVHAGVRYRNPKLLDCAVTGNYHADIYFDNENSFKEPGYVTMDVSLSRALIPGVTAYVNVENVFDEAYPIARSRAAGDTVAPGAIVAGGVKGVF